MTVLFALIAFLLPLKFGGLAAVSDCAGYFPDDLWEYLIITWPPAVFTILAAVPAVIVYWRRPLRFRESPAGRTALLWSLGLTAATLLGFAGPESAPEWSRAELVPVLGTGCWALALAALLTDDPRRGRWLLAGAALGGFAVVFYGIYQHFYGLDLLRNFVADQAYAGVPTGQSMFYKLTDNRIYSTLAGSNALAGYLLTVLPLMFYFARQASGHFTPVRLSRGIFITFTAVTAGWVLWLSGSRSVVLCLGAAAFLALLTAPVIRWKYRAAGAVLAVLLVAGALTFAVCRGRGSGSMAERGDYLRTCALITCKYPLLGGGWSSFFFTHMRVKLTSTDESARDPHNFVAAYAAQTGIFGLLAVLGVLIYPLVKLFPRRFQGLSGACFWGLFLFTVHLLMDCDRHIPACMAMGVLLGIAGLTAGGEPRGGRLCFTAAQLPCRALTLVLAVTAVSCGWIWLRGEYALGRFLDAVHPATADMRERYRGADISELYGEAMEWRPDSALIPEVFGDWFFYHGDRHNARRFYDLSLAKEPRRPSVYRRLAALYTAAGEPERAMKYRRRAHELFPKNPKYSLDINPEEKKL